MLQILVLVAVTMPAIAAPPTPFKLLYPGDPDPELPNTGFSHSNILFDWGDSFDPDGGGVTYELQIFNATCRIFGICGAPDYGKSALTASSTFSSGEISATRYFWKALAIDEDGEVTESTADFYFEIGGGAGTGTTEYRIIDGLVSSDLANAQLGGASVNVVNLSAAESVIFSQDLELDGSFNLLVQLHYPEGETPDTENEVIDVEIDKPGFRSTVTRIPAGADVVVPVNISLEALGPKIRPSLDLLLLQKQ